MNGFPTRHPNRKVSKFVTHSGMRISRRNRQRSRGAPVVKPWKAVLPLSLSLPIVVLRNVRYRAFVSDYGLVAE